MSLYYEEFWESWRKCDYNGSLYIQEKVEDINCEKWCLVTGCEVDISNNVDLYFGSLEECKKVALDMCKNEVNYVDKIRMVELNEKLTKLNSEEFNYNDYLEDKENEKEIPTIQSREMLKNIDNSINLDTKSIEYIYFWLYDRDYPSIFTFKPIN